MILGLYPCDLCGARNEELLYTKEGILTRHPFRVVRCRSCGLIYVNPRLPEQSIAELYDEKYYHGEGFDSNVNYVADFEKEDRSEKIVRPEETVEVIEDIVPPPARLLDFGCGLGDLLKQATRRGYDAEGFEISAYAAKFARRNGFRVFDDLGRLPSDRYDIITAIDVLEHCASPMKALLAIHRSLKPGGTLYYNTLNFDGYYNRLRRGIKDDRDIYVAPEGHIHFFSTAAMKLYFKKIGYSPVRFEPKAYLKNSFLFYLLSRAHLIEAGDMPRTFLGKFFYYVPRNIATFLGLRRGRLPLARKYRVLASSVFSASRQQPFSSAGAQ